MESLPVMADVQFVTLWVTALLVYGCPDMVNA